jgi:hypothetical protein
MRTQFVDTLTASKDNILASVPMRTNYLAYRPGPVGTVSITCHNSKARRHAFDVCPWANAAVPAEGGYMCFESIDDAKIWKNQK